MPAEAVVVASSSQDGASSVPSPWWVRAGAVGLVSLGFVAVLSLHGFAPGLSQPALQTFLAVGDVQCLSLMGTRALTSYCDRVGVPVGRPFLTGLPSIYLAWGVSYLPGVDAWRAHQVVNVLTALAGFLGAFGLGRRWTAPGSIAAVGALAYLASLSLVYLNGFVFTFAGFVLLPLYVLLFLRMLDAAERGRPLPVLAVAMLLPAFALFTDGYSFVAMLLVTGVLGLAWAGRRPVRLRRWLPTAGVWSAGVVLAYAAYTRYVPPGAEELAVGIGAFRFLGLDVATLVLPQGNLWWTAATGSGFDLSSLWGDGSNVAGNYVGLVGVVLVGWLLLRGARGLDARTAGECRAVALVAVVALLLSLGPALKVMSVEVPVQPAWDVPAEMTTSALPTVWLYEHVPGLDKMRATYRWFTVTRLAVVLLSVVAAGLLWRSGRRGVAWALLVVAVAETLVDVPSMITDRGRSADHVAAVRWEVVPEAQRLLEPGERVLALPPSNDFLASAVFVLADVRSYNVGVDRNYRLASQSWPASVRSAVGGLGAPDQNDRICEALVSDVDAVVIPRFSLYQDALSWPPSDAVVADSDARAGTIVSDPRFVAERGRWFVTVRPTPDVVGSGCSAGDA